MLEYAILMGRVKFETKFGNGRKYYICKIWLYKVDLSDAISKLINHLTLVYEPSTEMVFTKYPVIK